MKHQLFRVTGIFCFMLLAVTAMAGTWNTNNFFYQPALDARGAAEKSNFDTGLNRVDAHLGRYKTLGDPGYSTLAEALTTIGSNKVTLNIPAGTVAINGNTTIGNNIALRVHNDGKFDVSSGVSLTINGPIDADPYQIFSGSGTVNLGGVSTIYDVWCASPPTSPTCIAASVGCRFIKTSGTAPLVYVKESGTGTSGWVASSGGSGATAFTGLNDVPSSYSGQTGKSLQVNAAANGLEFYTPSSSGGPKPFYTLGNAGYTTLSEAITSIGSTTTTLVIPVEAGNVAVNSNTTIPANVSLKIMKGGKFAIANGVTLTVNGSIEAGPYQIFSCTGTGKVDLSQSPTNEFSLAWWGITSCPMGGPYTGDISSALLAAANARNNGGGKTYITVPAGIYHLATPTTLLKSWSQFKLLGLSTWDTQIYVDVGSSNVGLTIGQVGGSSTLSSNNLDIGQLSFVGGSNCCASALRIIETHNIDFNHLNIFCGSTKYALSLEGCLFVRGYVEVSGPCNGAGVYTQPYDGIKIASASNGYQSNVTDLRVAVHHTANNGVLIDGTSEWSATVKLTGSIEWCPNRPLWVYNQTLIDLTNLYTEGGGAEILLDMITDGRVNGLLMNGTADVHVARSHNLTLDNLYLTSKLIIDQDCSGITVGNGNTSQPHGLVNNAPDTKFTGNFSIYGGRDSFSLPGHDAQNLWDNAGLTRWNSTYGLPDGQGWNNITNQTWTQESTTKHWTPYCAKIVTSGGDGVGYFNFNSSQLQQMKGQWVNLTLFALLPAGESYSSYPYIYLGFQVPTWAPNTQYKVGDAVKSNPDTIGYYFVCVQAGTSGSSQPTWNHSCDPLGPPVNDRTTDNTVVWAAYSSAGSSSTANPLSASDVGTWTPIRVNTFCPNNATGVTGMLFTKRKSDNSYGTLYIAEPTLMLGRQGPRGAVLSHDEFQDSVMIGGMRMDWGTAPPNDGRWCNRGDFRFNSNPSPGQNAGWMCTASGNAGTTATWKALGNLAN